MRVLERARVAGEDGVSDEPIVADGTTDFLREDEPVDGVDVVEQEKRVRIILVMVSRLSRGVEGM